VGLGIGATAMPTPEPARAFRPIASERGMRLRSHTCPRGFGAPEVSLGFVTADARPLRRSLIVDRLGEGCLCRYRNDCL
jgi:hypothetical protein